MATGVDEGGDRAIQLTNCWERISVVGKRKIPKEGEEEVRRWIEDEGRTYKWMVEEYDRKYNLKVSPLPV